MAWDAAQGAEQSPVLSPGTAAWSQTPQPHPLPSAVPHHGEQTQAGKPLDYPKFQPGIAGQESRTPEAELSDVTSWEKNIFLQQGAG